MQEATLTATDFAKEAAARFLYRRGYEIVARDWTCKAGTADIIARDGDTVVFAEVRSYPDLSEGLPGEAVDVAKRSRWESVAALFLLDYDALDVPLRFDVVSVGMIDEERALIRHHIDAGRGRIPC